MAINPLSAAGAYANASRIGSATGMEARGDGNSFADMVKEAGRSAAQEMRSAEQLSGKAAAKEADLLQVVNAVSNAEVSLQTVVAVRDRVIQAYQDIIRMPI